MTKKDVLELKKRWKKNECTFTKLCGCYVNGEKDIILNLEETFLNLDEEEFYKYLEIAKKTLSGTIGDNLIELEFPLEEEKTGGKQQFLLGLRESKLKNEGLLESFYQLIIDNYDYAGNYLILIFHDAYDVMTKTSDNAKLDESEEVYEYLLCAICPVTLTKAGLGYLEDENKIGPRNRDWVVNVPDTGFLFPAFTDRSTDIHSVMYFTKDTKEPHKELMEFVLGCPPRQTATEQKNTFQTIISKAIPEEDKSSKVFIEIQESLNQLVDEHTSYSDSEQEPLLLTKESIQDIIQTCDLPEEVSKQIEESYTEEFKDAPPVVDHLIDNKLLAAHAKIRKEQELVEKVQQLQVKLEEALSSNGETLLHSDYIDDDSTLDMEADSTTASNAVIDITSNRDYDVILRVKPKKMSEITSQVIDGKKCIIIPLDENEQADVDALSE
ncbi:MAG TPA: DUF4317 domain-containing protein [Lachnospiraceae bacterium]|nr:DUF4317 domain-containing protein [Lachnospiraceae bacterium]